jgi:hypothetical protein
MKSVAATPVLSSFAVDLIAQVRTWLGLHFISFFNISSFFLAWDYYAYLVFVSYDDRDNKGWEQKAMCTKEWTWEIRDGQ